MAADSNTNPVEARQFDFWLGEWDLTWGENEKGSNTITTILDGKVIQEEFDGSPGMDLKGLSVSSYNPRLGKWQQTWVDNAGGYLDFVGGWVDGEMILSRDAVHEGKPIKQRMVFRSIAADSLDWDWERSDDGGETWQAVWQIHYQRK